jgi:hypothetical protein
MADRVIHLTNIEDNTPLVITDAEVQAVVSNNEVDDIVSIEEEIQLLVDQKNNTSRKISVFVYQYNPLKYRIWVGEK